MFYCLDCERTFEYPETAKGDNLECFGTPCWEEFTRCPFCKSTDFVPTTYCKECGQLITTPEYYQIGGNAYCSDCCEKRDMFNGGIR